MATGQDYIDKYLRQKGTTNNEGNKDNGTEYRSPNEAEPLADIANLINKVDADAEAYKTATATDTIEKDEPTGDVTPQVEQSAEVTPVAPSVKVDKPQVAKVDVTNYSRRPEYKIANGKIVGINRYVYINDNKNYYTENGEKIEAYKSGDKTDMPTLSPEEEVTARVKTVYDQFKDRIANAKPTDFGAIRNDLWKALNWDIDFSHYEDKDAEDKLKDVALGELGRQYQEQNPKMRIKAEAFSPKYYRENLAKESEKENAEAGRTYVKDGASLYDLASGQNMLTNVNQRAIEATKWLNTETQWRIKAAEGEAKRDRGFWSGLKGLGLGLVHGTRSVIHGGVNGGIEASVMGQVAGAAKSLGEGKELTGDQSRLIDAYLNYCESEKAYQDDFGYCYKLGQNTAISAPFMLEFILNPLSGAGEAAIRGISKKLIQRYGVDWVKQGVARLSNREVKAVMERSIRNYIGKQAGKILTEKTAKVVGKYGAKAVGLASYGVSSTISSALMTATSGLPGVYADKVNRQLNDGESEGEAWRKAGLSAMNERGSEYAGPLFTPFLKVLGKSVAKVGTSVVGKERLSAFASALNKTWPVGATRELIHDIAQLDSYKIMKDITKRAHWDGFFEEDFEEKFGSFMDAAFIGDQHFLDKNGNIDWKGENSFFNLKERFDESVNVGFTTLLLGVGGASGYRTPKYRLANALKTYDALGAQLYGDNWASFKATIESAKPEQLSSVLVGCMQAGASRQQLETLANYAYTYSMLDASVELERGMRESNDTDNEQVDAEQSYDDGYTLEKQQRNDAKNRLDDTQKTATSLLHLENTDELDNAIGLNEDNSNAVEVMKGINARTDINDYAKQKLNEYVNARLRYQGTIDAAKDDIDSKIAISDKTIDNQANEEGMVQTATLKNGTAVYIRSGNVSIDTKSGEVISSESDGTLVVQDQVSGEMQMIPSSDVLYLTSNVSADELKTEAANKIRMESAQQHAQEIDGILPFHQGDVYDMEDKDGNPLQVQVINDLGDGNVNVLLNGQTATIAKEQLQTLNDNYNQRRLQVWKANQEQDTNNGAGQEQGDNENAPTEGAEEKKSALAQIPVDKNGVRQYTEAMPTTAYDALVEATGSREGADQVVEAEKAKAKKALEEALNRKPEGNTTDEIVASAREIFDAKQKAQEAHRYWDAVGRTMQVRSEMRKKGISNAVDMALAAHAALDETEDMRRFNNLAETLPSLEGEEREKVLAEMASMAEAYARANGYDATICKTADEYLQSPGITDDVRQNVGKLGLLVPGHYFQGHVYINIEDMTKVTGISASDMLSSTLLHESTHMDNATDEGGVMAHLREALDNGEVDTDEALDIIEAVSGTDDYRRQARELQEQGKSPSELVADELMAHMLQAMSWGVPVESMTKNETLTNIISEANERREKVRTSGEEISQRSESADDVSRGQVQPSGATARDNETEQSGRGVRADGESGVRNSIRNDNQRKAAENAYDFAKRNMPGEEWHYAIVNMERPGAIPEYKQKRDLAKRDCSYYNELGWGNYKVFDLNKTFEENTDYMTGLFPEEYDVRFSVRLQDAIDETDTNPTEAQKASGNYKKGHIKFGGYDYTIENPKGSTRSGKNANGEEWKVTMNDTYGYIRGTKGKDGDHLDMFINDNADLDTWNGNVYVVDQVNEDGTFDEHKVMYGYDTEEEAKKAYLANYSKGWTGLGNITGVSKESFDKWLDASNRKMKPFAEYKEFKENGNSLLDAVRTLYSKGKDFASHVYGMKFFDVVKTPSFMKDKGLTGDKFTIRYGVLSRHFGKDGSHDFTEYEWQQLPDAIKKPFGITKLTNKKDGYRIYTTLKTEKGEYVVVGADVKNAGRNIEVNAIATIFGRREDANLPKNEEIVYESEEITPEQKSLLSQPNSDQYPTVQELSTANLPNPSESAKEKEGKFSLRDNESAEKVYADEARVPTQEELGEGLAEEVKDYVPQAVPWDGGALYDGQNAPVKYSVRGAALGIGLKPLVGEDGKLTLLDPRGRKFDKNHPVSVDDIKRTDSVLNAMVDICTKNGTLKNPEVIYQKYADFVNRVLEKGDKGFSYLTDQWQWQGEALYRSVHNNSDSQYAKSIDITRICKKNEAVIHTISELQKRQGYGVTVGQILDIYNQTVEDGYQAPCPVCYVFSRYLRNGVFASTLVAGQRRYGNMLVDPKTLSEQEKKKRVEYWVKELDSLEKFYAENKEAISQAKDDIRDIFNEVDGIAMDIAKGKLKGKELADAKKRIAELDKRYRAAVDLVSVSDLTGYIKQIAIEKKDGNWTLRTDSWKQYPENVALDITRAQEAIVEYPGVQRYRNSHGSAAGKAIQTASNNDLGDTMVALGLGNPEARDKRTRKLSRHNTLLKAFADGISEKEQTKLLNQAKGDIKKATVYAAQQMLRGGIRQWSWSDNVERLSPDVFLNLMQVNMLGGALQAYSKQLEGVELVASMDGYVNGSLMGKGKGYKEVDKDYKDAPIYYNPLDGKYYTLEFDDVVGIQPFSKDGKMGLFDLNKMYDRAGNILVGMDDLHVRAAMADPRVFFIIPWHSSGMTNHILMQFYNYLGVDTNGLNAQDYTKIQEEKTYGADDAVPQEMTDFWESHNFGDKYKSGIGEIPSGNGKLSEQQLHYRELKNALLTHNSLLLDKPKGEIRSKRDEADYEFWNEHRDWLEEIKNDEFLSLVLDKVQKTVNALGANMTKGDTEYVYPYEYWDVKSTESNADVNGERYLEYCRRLGIRPKFSGITNGGIVDFGNFCEDPGYWKLLIDRRMYDRKGNFQDLTPVTVEGFDVDMVDPEKTKERFEVTRVAELDKISDVVDHVQAREQERGIVPEVDYTQKLSKAVEKYNKATARFSVRGEEDNETAHETEENPLFSIVKDKGLIEKLDSEPKIKVYRCMQVIDGQLYPPMSAKVNGKLRQPTILGQWEQAEEDTEKADGKGYVTLNKGNGKSLKARYNPYLHSSKTMLNDQFSEAQTRDNLVVVEMEVPMSELTSGYKADKAMDSVGLKQWKAGVIQGQMTGKREVILSRWAKPVRIVPVEEVAENIAHQIKGHIDVMPTNVVTPQQREALEALGVKFVETDNRGNIQEGENAGKTWASVYGKNKGKSDDVRYSVRESNSLYDTVKSMDALPVKVGSTKKEDVRDAYNSLGQATNKKDRKTVTFYRGVFGKMWRGEDSMFAKIAPSLGKLFENSVYGFSSADNLNGQVRPDGTIHKEHRNIDSYDYYIGKANVEGKDYYVRFTIQNEHKGASGVHDVMCTNVEIYENPTGDASTSTMRGGRLVTNEVSDAKLMDLFGLTKVEDGNLQDEAKFSFIGERGAESADHAEEVTTRLDNLSIARSMEAAKKDAKTIKLATGWERGADGQWRYEMPDAKIKDTTDIGGGHIVKRSEKDMLWNGGKLGKVVDAPELFKAYPQLKNIKLSTDAIMNDMSINGVYNNDTKTITIHADELKCLNSILNHEIQHAIQFIEGFALGTHTKSASVRAGIRKSESFREGQERLADKVGYKYDMLSPSTQILDGDYFFGNIPKVTEIEKKFGVDHHTAALVAYLKDVAENGDSVYGKIPSNGVKEINKTIDKLLKRAQKNRPFAANGTNTFGPYDIYRRHSGEVESRNVESRMNMSAEERRASLASETEDVAREDQIFLFGNEARFSVRQANERFNEELDEAKFSIRNSSDLVSDISEKGLGGAVGKEAVGKFVDGLYMTDADIRKEINKGIGKAGFNYATATRNFLGDIANGEVSAETWHKVRTAFQGMLRENGINANLTDADIAYALWKEANPGNDVISKAKDIAMQMDMGAGRFSLVGGPRAGMALDEYNRKALSSRLDWQEAWQDAMVSAKALQDAIAEETQSPITDSEDVYHAENRMYGSSKNEVEHYEDNYLNPLLKAVSDVLEQSKKNTLGMDYKGLMDYLMAKHGLERNSFFALKTRIAEEQQKRADQVTAQMKAQAEQDYQDALNKAGQLTGIDLMNAVKAANRAKAKADRIAEQTGVEEGRKLRDALYDGYTNDADLAQLKNDLRIKKITFREFEMRKRDIMEKHVKGTIKMIEDQGDKAGLSNIMDDDTDYENLAFDFVDSIESRLTTDTLWKRINSATGNTLEKSYSSGRMTKKAYDYVNSMFDFYVPLRGWDETTADEVYEYENASRPVFTPAVKRMFGRKSKAEDPIAYIGNQAVSEISLGNKNLMKQYLLRLAQNHPTSALSVSEVWYENVGTQSKPQWVEVAPNITEGMSASDITAEMDRFKQDMEQKRNQGMAKRQSEKLSVGMPILPMQENEHRVDVMVDGQKYSIFVNGSPKAAQAINGTNKKNVDFHLGDNFISKTNRFISEVLTSKNPAFVPANFARDMLGAHSQIWTKEDAGYIWNFEKNVAKVITTPRIGGKLGVTGYMPELLRKWKAGTLDTNNDIERYFSEFMEHGGETGYVNMLGVDKFKENIQKKLDNFNGHYGKNAWNAVWDTVEFYNRAVEDATRFITYMTSREQGRSVDRAIDDAKTISLNFNRKGTGAKGNALLRKLVIFVNPAIQALDNQFKLISQHPGRYAAVVGSLILRGMAQSKLNELLINLLGDDDDKDSYYQIPEWTRRNNLVLWIPGTHNFFKIPLSQEFRMWYGLGETMQGIIDGKTKSNPAMELATSMMGLLPVDPSGNGGNPIANVMPTIAKPVYEITQNENFLGLPIYKDNQGNEYEPEFQRVSYGTPSWLTKASEGLNMLTGGDTHERGALEQWTAGNKYARLLTNPSVWNHLLSGYVGGPYNIISQSIGLGTDFYEGKGLTVGNTPIVSRFVARPSERNSAGRTSDIYRDLVKEAEETRSHYSHYRKDYEKAVANGDKESAQKAMGKMREITESPEFLKMRTIEVYDKQINKIRQIIKLYDDKESKKRYGEMIKRLEENLLMRLEAHDAEEANIKK